MATPLEKSWLSVPRRAVTPISASLLLRTIRPNWEDNRGSDPVTSRQFSSSSLVPKTPAAKTTCRARVISRGRTSQAVLDRCTTSYRAPSGWFGGSGRISTASRSASTTAPYF